LDPEVPAMKFRQIGLYVSDLDRAVDFYSKLLKLEVTARFDTPGNEWLAFIEDSENNLVGLMSRKIR